MVRGGNNHASPTGALPFVLPAGSLLPVSAGKGLEGWGLQQKNRRRRRSGTFTDAEGMMGKSKRGGGVQRPQSRTKEDDSRMDVYRTLITGPIRRAWLYTLYISASASPSPSSSPSSSPSPANQGSSKTTLQTLYINPSTSHPLVRKFLEYQLQGAALRELLNAPEGVRVVDVERLYKDAEKAWEALSVFLGGREWFEGYCGGEKISEEVDDEGVGGEGVDVDEAVDIEANEKQKNTQRANPPEDGENCGDDVLVVVTNHRTLRRRNLQLHTPHPRSSHGDSHDGKSSREGFTPV